MPLNYIASIPGKLKSTKDLHSSGKLHGQIVQRLLLMAVIVAALAAFGIYDLTKEPIASYVVLVLLIPGVLLGLVVGHLWRVRWDEQRQLIVGTQMDWASAAVLLGYIFLRAALTPLIRRVFPGTEALPAVLLFGTGIFIGRLIGMMIVVHNTYDKSQTAVQS